MATGRVRASRRRRSGPAAFQQAMGRRPARVGMGGQPFHEPITSVPTLDRAALPFYWHPQRHGVEEAPAWFAAQLAGMHADLRCVRPPANAPLPYRAWTMWYRKPSITHALCPGWLLLFEWVSPTNEPLPLDNRVLANLYLRSRRAFPSAVKYFDRCMQTSQERKARRKATFNQESRDRRREYLDFMQIKNTGTGNKFALHHDGTVVPSRGQQNWMQETRARLPSSVVRDRERRQDQRASR